MNLLTHETITSTAKLEVAATTVETALQSVQNCKAALQADARRVPNKSQQPTDEADQRRWIAMYEARNTQALFDKEHLRVAYLVLRGATEDLANVLAEAHTEATELQSTHGQKHDGAYRAALNVSVCDALRVLASDTIAKLESDAEIGEPTIMNRIDANSQLKKLRRAFVVHQSTGNGWENLYICGPLSTEDEAEELARKVADKLSAVEGTSYWVRIIDVVTNRPAGASRSRFCQMLISDDGFLIPRP